MRKIVEESNKTKGIFCDIENVPENRSKNYFLLVTKLFNAEEIDNGSIIFKELLKSIQLLDERRRDIINLKFGLIDGEFKTLKFISEKYRISKERVRQILEQAYQILGTDTHKYDIHKKIAYLEKVKSKIEKEIRYYTECIKNPKYLELTIFDLDFSTKAINSLCRNRIIGYTDLITVTAEELIHMKSIGTKTANEIWHKIHGQAFPLSYPTNNK